jgi:hypothetical protein
MNYKRIGSLYTTGFRPEWGGLNSNLAEFTDKIAHEISPYLSRAYEQKALTKYRQDSRKIFIRAAMKNNQCRIEFFIKNN